jgi:peptidyl-prolyl cis-trans isomerase D
VSPVIKGNGAAYIFQVLEKNAQKFGFRVQERTNLYNSEHNVAGIRSTREAMKWIFDSKAGEVSPLYECGNNDHLMVVALTKINKVGYRDLDDVKDQLKQEVVNDKKFDKLAQQLAGVKDIAAAKAKGAVIDTVKQVTFAAPVFVQSSVSSEPALSGAVASVKQGGVSPVIKGNGAAYIFQVLEKKTRSDAKFDAKQQQTQLEQQAMQAASRFMNEMYLKAGVVDNRYLFF